MLSNNQNLCQEIIFTYHVISLINAMVLESRLRNINSGRRSRSESISYLANNFLMLISDNTQVRENLF